VYQFRIICYKNSYENQLKMTTNRERNTVKVLKYCHYSTDNNF